MLLYATQRQQEILEYLNIKKAASVAQLCVRLYASPATIRRDLARMEQRGLLRRTHGGAVLAEGGSDEVSMFARQAVNARQKAEIAKLAACFVKDSDNLFMDSSSTVCSVAARLDHCHDGPRHDGITLPLLRGCRACLLRRDFAGRGCDGAVGRSGEGEDADASPVKN